MEGHDAEIDYLNYLETKPYVGAIILVLAFMVLGIIGNVHVLFVYTFRMKATSHRLKARFLKTCRPFGEQIDPNRAKLLCAVVVAFCILLFWPIPVFYGHNTVVTPNPNIAGVSCYIDDAFKESVYLTYWNGIVLIMVLCLLFGLVVLYYMIGKSIRKHVQSKNKLLFQGQTNEIPGKSRHHASGCRAGGFLHEQRKDEGSGEKTNVESNMCCKPVNKESFISDVEPREVSFNTENESRRESTTADTTIDHATITRTIDVDEKNEDELKDKDTSRDETTKQSQLLNAIAGGNNMIQVNEKAHITVNDIPYNNHEDISNNSDKPEEQAGICRENFHKHREALQKLKRSNRTTKMSFAITILYFVTFVPYLTLWLLTLTQDDFVASLSFTGQTVYHMVFCFSFLNSVVNCYVYGFFDTMFRDELRKIYTCKFCKRL